MRFASVPLPRVDALRTAAAVLLCLVVATGCTPGNDLVGGSWTAEDGRTLVFSTDGTVEVQGATAEYEVDGDRILIDGEPVYTSVTWVSEDEFRAHETFSPGGAPRLLRFTRSR